MKRKLNLFFMVIILVLSFSSCQATDIVGNAAIDSFNEVLNAIPDSVTKDTITNGWSLTAPDGSIKFLWGPNDTDNTMFIFDSKPFIDAGLDVNKLLGENIDVDGDKIVINKLSGLMESLDEENGKAISYFKNIVRLSRSQINYHADMDHFGVSLYNGNVFEFAKDMTKNDKDIVFILNPQVFIDAGVDPEKVDGWVYDKIKAMESNGRTYEVYKFLKPFNLK